MWGLGWTKAYGHRRQRAQGCGPRLLWRWPEPQGERGAVTDGYVAVPVPLPGVPCLQDGDGVDSRAVRFLLKLRKKEEKGAREKEAREEEEQEKEKA